MAQLSWKLWALIFLVSLLLSHVTVHFVSYMSVSGDTSSDSV